MTDLPPQLAAAFEKFMAEVRTFVREEVRKELAGREEGPVVSSQSSPITETKVNLTQAKLKPQGDVSEARTILNRVLTKKNISFATPFAEKARLTQTTPPSSGIDYADHKFDSLT